MYRILRKYILEIISLMNNNQTNAENSKRTMLGIILAIIGISAGGLVKVVFNLTSNTISIAISVMSVVLMLNTLRHYRAFSRDMGWIVGFYALTLFYALLSNRGFSDAHGLLYQLFYFAQILVLWNAKRIDHTKFISYAYHLFLLVNLLGFFLVYRNAQITGRIAFATLGNNEIVTRATVGNIGLILFSACIVYRPKQGIHKLLYGFAWFLAIANLLLASRRTAIVEALIILIIYCIRYKPRINSISSVIKIVAIVIGVVVAIIVLYLSNSTVRVVVDRSFQMLVSGVNTFVGVDRSDMGASYRRNVLETVPHELINTTNVKEIFVGRGFMEGWFDVPYLQAFWDMGLLGGIFFLIIQLIIPIKYILVRSKNPAILFAQCCVVSRLVDNVASGVCYGSCLYLVMLMTLIIQDREMEAEEITE